MGYYRHEENRTHSKLLRQVLAIEDKSGASRALDNQIMRGIRDAKRHGHSEYADRLRLVRAEYLLRIGKPVHAGKTFRRVLKHGGHEVAAMIGIADTYLQSRKVGKAEEWLQTALARAEANVDYNGQLNVLDTLACRAVVFGDKDKSTSLLHRMSELISEAPLLNGSFTLAADTLIDFGRPAESLLYLEAYVGRLAALNASYYDYTNGALYLLVNAYRQMGMDDDAIEQKLLEYRDQITDTSSSEEFAERVKRDIARRPLRARPDLPSR